jgi:hypothetical protein
MAGGSPRRRWDPGRQRWEVVARSPKPVGRLSRPDYLVGDGEDELHALTDLALKLDAIRQGGSSRPTVA